MSEPTETITDQMLSAYLDDELSADERLRVERAVAQDPRYAQLLQQLQSVREALQDLPRHRLDEGFSRRVMQQIANTAQECAGDGVATGSDQHSGSLNRLAGPESSGPESSTTFAAGDVMRDAEPTTDGAPRTQPEQTATRPATRDWRRPLVWSSLALAAALLVMVLVRDKGREGRQVATAPDAQEQFAARLEKAENLALRAPDPRDAPPGLAGQPVTTGREFAEVPSASTAASDRDVSDTILEEDEAKAQAQAQEQLSEALERRRDAVDAVDGLRAGRRGVTEATQDALLPRPTETNVQVALQADVTSDQLNNLFAQLRQDQISIVPDAATSDNGTVHEADSAAANEPAQAADRGRERTTETAETPIELRAWSLDSSTGAPPTAMRLVILEAPLEQIRESLARANVKGEVVDSRQVGRLDRYFADQAARPSASAVGQYPAQVPMTVEPAVAPPARGGAAAPSVSLEAVEQVAPPRQAQAEPAGPRSESQRAQRAADTPEGGRAEESHGRRDTRAAEPPDFEGARAKAVQRILLLLRIVDPPVATPTTPTAPAGATP